MTGNWDMNDGALWCPSCGNMIARDTDDHIPEECRQCGFPDPEAVADYHFGPDDDDDDGDPDAWVDDCGMMPDGYCSKAGSEECDWECPRGGLA